MPDTAPDDELTQITDSAEWVTAAPFVIHAITTFDGTPGDAGIQSDAFDSRIAALIAGAVGVSLASKDQGDLADTATQPGDLGTVAALDVDTDTTMASPSDGVVPSQQAVVTYIAAQIANLINSAPGALDTLDELAAALGDDADFVGTVTTALAGKQPLDTDLTAIAALSTTTYGRALLVLADQAALQTAVGVGTAGLSNSYDDLDDKPTIPTVPGAKHWIPFTFDGELEVGSGLISVPVPADCTVTGYRVKGTTAPTGASIIFDINKNGTTLFSTQGNRPTVAASGTTSTTTAPDVTAFTAGDFMSVDVDQIGSTIAGSNFVVMVEVTET